MFHRWCEGACSPAQCCWAMDCASPWVTTPASPSQAAKAFSLRAAAQPVQKNGMAGKGATTVRGKSQCLCWLLKVLNYRMTKGVQCCVVTHHPADSGMSSRCPAQRSQCCSLESLKAPVAVVCALSFLYMKIYKVLPNDQTRTPNAGKSAN